MKNCACCDQPIIGRGNAVKYCSPVCIKRGRALSDTKYASKKSRKLVAKMASSVKATNSQSMTVANEDKNVQINRNIVRAPDGSEVVTEIETSVASTKSLAHKSSQSVEIQRQKELISVFQGTDLSKKIESSETGKNRLASEQLEFADFVKTYPNWRDFDTTTLFQKTWHYRLWYPCVFFTWRDLVKLGIEEFNDSPIREWHWIQVLLTKITLFAAYYDPDQITDEHMHKVFEDDIENSTIKIEAQRYVTDKWGQGYIEAMIRVTVNTEPKWEKMLTIDGVDAMFLGSIPNNPRFQKDAMRQMVSLQSETIKCDL